MSRWGELKESWKLWREIKAGRKEIDKSNLKIIELVGDEWVSVKDRLPENNKQCLFLTTRGEVWNGAFVKSPEGWRTNQGIVSGLREIRDVEYWFGK